MCWTLHIAEPMANDTTLKSPMANEHCRLYTVVHLTCWPTSRSKWSQMVVCAVNWGRWLPVQLITDYSYRQPNQTIQRWCVRKDGTIQEDTNYWLLIADQHRCCLFQTLPTQLTPPARWVVLKNTFLLKRKIFVLYIHHAMMISWYEIPSARWVLSSQKNKRATF